MRTGQVSDLSSPLFLLRLTQRELCLDSTRLHGARELRRDGTGLVSVKRRAALIFHVVERALRLFINQSMINVSGSLFSLMSHTHITWASQNDAYSIAACTTALRQSNIEKALSGLNCSLRNYMRERNESIDGRLNTISMQSRPRYVCLLRCPCSAR